MGVETLNAYIDYLLKMDEKNAQRYNELVDKYNSLGQQYVELVGLKAEETE